MPRSTHSFESPQGALVRTSRLTLAVTAVLAMLAASPASAAGTWQTTLQGRDLDGNAANGYEAYYDTDLQITWLANAAAFNGSWDDAKAWAGALNVNGVTGWRLPDVKPVNGGGFNYAFSQDGSTDFGYGISSTQNELGHMYHVTLGNTGSGPLNAGPFSNFLAESYWTDVQHGQYPNNAWYFYAPWGFQGHNGKMYGQNAWAVHSGDVMPTAVTSVPEPQTYALALAGLVVVGRVAQRRRS